jgi:predicted metal-dependent phosphoesterase TrpH
MRCDLHVHTDRSGMCTIPLLKRVCRESYNDPLAVYSRLKQRGMDLVTVTDHDSIDAAESLRRFPDFFLSEQITCVTPAGTELHLGVYDIAERDHVQVQCRRTDLAALAAYLDERNIFSTVNHVFSGLTGNREWADFTHFRELFPGLETRNGQLMTFCNRKAEVLAERWRKASIAGSDAHTLSTLGRTFTEVQGARSKTEFLEAVRHRRAQVRGISGNYVQLTLAIATIGFHFLRHSPWGIAALPLMPAVPLATLASCTRDLLFAHKWSRRLASQNLTCLRAQEET